MRKIILLLVAVVALVWGFVTVSLRSRIAKAAPAIAHEISDKLGARVDIGDVDINLFPVAANLRNVKVARYEQPAHPFLTIESLRFDAAFWPLLTGKLEVREVVAEKPHVEILREQDGRQQSDLSDRLLASLAKLPFMVRIVDGSLLIEDRMVTPPRRASADHVDGTAAGAVEGALIAELAGSVLGSSDTATLSLKLVPAAGPTGGDSVTVDFQVKDGKAAAVKDAFVILRGVDFVDPVALRFQASGLLGEKSTETVPAEPLPGKLSGSVGLKIAELNDRLEFDTEVAFDDARYQVRRGKARWGGFAFETTGWVTRKIPQKISGRLVLERFALAAAAERFGFAERWRPKGDMDLTIRATGTSDEPLIRHEGKIDSLSFDGFPGLPIKAAPVTISGSLAAINTDVSVSLNLSNLEVGTARFDKRARRAQLLARQAHVHVARRAGVRRHGRTDRWRSGRSSPTTWKAASWYRDSDAETVLSNIAPRLALDIYGRTDGVAELKKDDDGHFGARPHGLPSRAHRGFELDETAGRGSAHRERSCRRARADRGGCGGHARRQRHAVLEGGGRFRDPRRRDHLAARGRRGRRGLDSRARRDRRRWLGLDRRIAAAGPGVESRDDRASARARRGEEHERRARRAVHLARRRAVAAVSPPHLRFVRRSLPR